MYWDNIYDLIKISVNKLNDKEYKLRISNKNNDTYETTINEYYWTSDFIELDDLKTLLNAGLKNETIDNLNCSTRIQQNESSISVTLSFRFENKFIKQKPSDIKFNLEKVNYDEITKHNFLIKDVVDELHPIIDNERVIRCCILLKYCHEKRRKIIKIINYADNKEILNIVVTMEEQNSGTPNFKINNFTSINNEYTLDMFKKNIIISNFKQDQSNGHFLWEVDNIMIFKYLSELNYRIFDISFNLLTTCKDYNYNYYKQGVGFEHLRSDMFDKFDLTLVKSSKKYLTEYIKLNINIENDGSLKISNKIEGKYKILYTGDNFMIIERQE
jgi:hypothetical protein